MGKFLIWLLTRLFHDDDRDGRFVARDDTVVWIPPDPPQVRIYRRISTSLLLDNDLDVGHAIKASLKHVLKARDFTQENLKETHLETHRLLATRSFGSAYVLSAINLIAACCASRWEWVEWTTGRLVECVASTRAPAGVRSLHALLEELKLRFSVSTDPRSALGITILESTLCAAIAEDSPLSLETEWLAKSRQCGMAAIPLADRVGVAPLQRGSIFLTLGKCELRLSLVTGGDNKEILEACVQHLSAAEPLLREAKSPLSVDVAEGLAKAHSWALRLAEKAHEEPALEPASREDLKQSMLRSGKLALEHSEAVLARKKVPSSTQATMLTLAAAVVESLAKIGSSPPNSDSWTAHKYQVRAAETLEREGDVSQAAVAYAAAAGMGARISRKLGLDAFQQAMPTLERSLTLSRKANQPSTSYQVAADAADFHVTYQSPVQWQAVYDFCREATDAFGHIADERKRTQGFENDHWTNQEERERFSRINKLHLRAAAKLGRVRELPRIWANQAVFTQPEGNPGALSRDELGHALLDPADAILYLDVDESGLIALIVHRGQATPEDFVWDEQATWSKLRDLVDPWLRIYWLHTRGSDGKRPPREALWSALEKMVNALQSLLWSRINPRLQTLRIRRIALVAGRGLNILPLYALPKDGKENAACLLDDYTFVHIPSPAFLRRGSAETPPAPRVLVIGNPTGDLNWAEAEAKRVGRGYSFWRRTCLIGSQATPKAVTKELANIDIAHFACHGEFALHTRGLQAAASGRLLLHGGDVEWESLLAIGFRRQPLVVLSACETGRVNWRDTDPTGIANGVLMAGARMTVASLWPVNDLSTCLLMDAFYSGLAEGQSAPTALRAAQIELRRMTSRDAADRLDRITRGNDVWKARSIARLQGTAADHTPFAHPYFWAPFYVAAGNLDAAFS